MRTIDRDELRTLLADGTLTLVDALPATQYQAEHIPGAVNLPETLTQQAARHLAPDRNGPVVTYCSGRGTRAPEAA